MFLPASGPADRRQEAPQDEERDQADRDVDEEDPVPADRVGDDPADGRSEKRRQAEDRPEEAEVLAAFGGGVEVGDHGQRDREDCPATKALDAPRHDELPHLLAEAGHHGANEEEGDGEDDDRPPPEQVGELAVDRTADRARQQVDRDDPDVEVVAAEIGHDPRQRHADDRLVEREQEERQQDRAEDLELGPGAQLESDLGGRVHLVHASSPLEITAAGTTARPGSIHGRAGRASPFARHDVDRPSSEPSSSRTQRNPTFPAALSGVFALRESTRYRKQ